MELKYNLDSDQRWLTCQKAKVLSLLDKSVAIQGYADVLRIVSLQNKNSTAFSLAALLSLMRSAPKEGLWGLSHDLPQQHKYTTNTKMLFIDAFHRTSFILVPYIVCWRAGSEVKWRPSSVKYWLMLVRGMARGHDMVHHVYIGSQQNNNFDL